ncbi:MAG: preprotein translocase subunit YajC [Proteobacteria bacterium]|nr:preprotein translocase subunit YajC [Pseudomonadota bacterium]
MNFFISDAMAQSADSASGGILSFLPLVILFVVFYFLLIRPQQKKAKQHKNMVAELKKGDEIITNGGVLGKITDVGENFLTCEIAEKVEIKVQSNAVSTLLPKGTIKSL